MRIPRVLEYVTECMVSFLENKAKVGEERIQIHAGHARLAMALVLHPELPSALGY